MSGELADEDGDRAVSELYLDAIKDFTEDSVGRIDEFASEFTVCALPRTNPNHYTFAITVAWRGSMFPDRIDRCWAVVRGSRCMNAAGEWVFEPSPSGRSDEWIEEHRFTLDVALEFARIAAPFVEVNGFRPA